MGQTADELRQEIDHKREDAASKIDAIEARVQDTAQMAKDTVQETMQSAKETVSSTVEQTVQTVKENADLKRQIEERPLVALGAALAGGFLLGGVLGGGRSEGSSGSGGHSAYRSQSGLSATLRGASRNAGLDDTIAGLSGVLMGSLTERIRSTMDQNFPQLAERIKQHQGSQGSQGPAATSNAEASRTFGLTGSGELPPVATSDASGRTAPHFQQERG